MKLMQTLLSNRLNIEVFTMHKYVDIIVDVLLSKINYLLNIFLYFMVCTYLGSWMDFWMNVTYSMFVMPLMGHIFHFPKSKISRLLYYLQIITLYEKVITQLFCKQFVTWINCWCTN